MNLTTKRTKLTVRQKSAIERENGFNADCTDKRLITLIKIPVADRVSIGAIVS